MNQELKETNLLLEALILHRMKLPNDEQSALRSKMIESLLMKIADIQFELDKQPL